MRIARVLGPIGALLMVACQAVISADFSDYTSLPTQCDPLAPTRGEPTFANCTGQQQCASSGNGFQCKTSNGTAGAGEACTDDVDCAQGSGCVAGYCRVYCDTSAPACESGQVCKSLDKRSGSRTIGACIKTCDLTAASSCDAGQHCTVVDGDQTCVAATGNAKAYDTCTTDVDCAPGLGCALIGHEPDSKSTPVSVCLRWAKQASDCTAPESRRTPESAPTIAGTTFGSCFQPCDPLFPNSPTSDFRTCGIGQRCSFLLDANKVNSVTLCTKLPSPPATRDDGCVGDDTCDSKLACRSFTNLNHCVDYCATQADCPMGRVCTPFANKRSVTITNGSKNYNYCAPPTPPCDPVSLSGCAQTETCALVDNDYGVCRPQGSGVLGDYCTGTGEFCKRGSECIGSPDYGFYCSQTCRVGTNDCGGSNKCLSLATPVKIGAQEYGYCKPPNCNPYSPQGVNPPLRNCPNGVECHFINSDTIACRSGGKVSEGGSCKFSADCGVGLFCIYSNGAGTCRVPCRVSNGGADCTARGKTMCNKLSSPFVIDGVEYGTCS